MTNQKTPPTYAEALREARARMAFKHGSRQHLEEQAVAEAVQKSQLTPAQAIRAIQGRDPYSDGTERAQAANSAAYNRAVSAQNTNLKDLALRMAGRADQEGRKVEDEIAFARGEHKDASVVKANQDCAAVAGLSFGERYVY